MSGPDTFTLSYSDVPPSLNRMATRGSHWKVTSAKRRWQAILTDLLTYDAGTPQAPYGRVCASAVLSFPVTRRRDSGNFSWLLEKALGDALVPQWIVDDTAERFSFAGVTFTSGAPETALTLCCFPEMVA